MTQSLILPDLSRYLAGSNWLASVQFLLFILIMYRLVDRGLQATGRWSKPLAATDPVANATMESLARLCLGLGLLLTFSGLYGYIGSGDGRDGQSLLMALGSSAIGYSSWALVAAAAVIDSLRGIESSDSAAAVTPPPRLPPLPPGPSDPRWRVPESVPTRLVSTTTHDDSLDSGPYEPVIVLGNDLTRIPTDEAERDDEQTSVDDIDCGSRLMGGPFCDADRAAAGDLGGLDGYQRPHGATGDDGA